VSQKGKLTDLDARKHLLSRIAPLQEALQASSIPSGRSRSSQSDPLDFSSLPGFDQLRLERAVGKKIGFGSPYFRIHEGRPSARTHIAGKSVIDFSSYDYLGLNGDPRVSAAAHEAIDRYGISATGSRHVSGERSLHQELERELARHYQCDDCVVLVSGYATNLGVIGQLVGPKDLLISDAIIHNSATAGGVLSGAARRSFAHNDLDDLERLLASNRSKFERTLIVVEGLYGMDGDIPDLKRLIDIKTRYSAWLMVDEAHALGVIGRQGYGSFEHCDVDPKGVDIWMGTLSKTLAGCGGFIAGSATLVDYVKSLVGVFVYSVGMPPVIVATAKRALDILHHEPDRVTQLQRNAANFHAIAKAKGLKIPSSEIATAVSPVLIGDSIPAVVLSHRLLERGVNVLPVLYPAVPANAARLRFFLTAMHSETDIETALDLTAKELAKIPDTMRALRIPGY
jgi:8-amino-7-oxononanoate synthase